MAVGSGLCLVDKPAGWTSHDVVARIRRLAGTRRVGHAGTLDPMATGLLVIGIDKATRLLGHLALTDKSYAATIRLGQATTTDDAEGELLSQASADAVTDEAVCGAARRFRGDQQQVPSAVSAIKVGGRRAYARVRAGEEVVLASRPVHISRLEVRRVDRPAPGLIDVEVTLDCSTGTYVRAIARDLGDALGVGGHLTVLRRTRVGPFEVAAARGLEELAALPSPVLLTLSEAAGQCFRHRHLDTDQTRLLSYGRPLAAVGLSGTYAAFDPDGAVVALLDERDGSARPVVVFAPA